MQKLISRLVQEKIQDFCHKNFILPHETYNILQRIKIWSKGYKRYEKLKIYIKFRLPSGPFLLVATEKEKIKDLKLLFQFSNKLFA